MTWIMDYRKPKSVVQEELGKRFLTVHFESFREDYDDPRDIPLLVWLLDGPLPVVCPSW